MVADHFGGTFPGDEGLPEFATFLDMIREKKVWVKISGCERLFHRTEKGMAAIEPIVKSAVESGPDQIVYGSDWPHTQLGVARKGKTDKQRLEEVEGFSVSLALSSNLVIRATVLWQSHNLRARKDFVS